MTGSVNSAWLKLDWVAALALVALGALHIFLAAPLTYRALSEALFWFIGAGLAFAYAGAVNLVRLASGAASARYAAVAVNLTLLAFAIAFDAQAGALLTPKAWVIIGVVALETAFSLAALRGRRPGK